MKKAGRHLRRQALFSAQNFLRLRYATLTEMLAKRDWRNVRPPVR
jgi:hypothetical protein